ASAAISRTSTTPRNSTFTVQVRDSASTNATKQLAITIDPATLTITTPSLPNGTVNTAYSQTLSAAGGTGGNTWTIASGALPTGLSLTGATIAGTPTTAGNN